MTADELVKEAETLILHSPATVAARAVVALVIEEAEQRRRTPPMTDKAKALDEAHKAGLKAANERHFYWTPIDSDDHITAICNAYAKARDASIRASGFAVAPVEATEKMLRAGCVLECTRPECVDAGECCGHQMTLALEKEHWSAMLAAAEGEDQ